MAPFPSAPELASAAWLTDVLAPAGTAPGRVVSLRRERLEGGKLGCSTRFHLTWSGAPEGAPASVVGKFPSADPRSRRTGVGSGVYLREVSFYRHLAARVALPVPRCYHARIDPSTGDFVMLLSDVAPARTVDQVAGASVGEVASALEVLPGLHAPFWGDDGLARHDWLPRRDVAGGRRMAAAYRLVVRQFLGRYGEHLSAETVSMFEQFSTKVGRWLTADRPPFTLLHGDYRVDNLLFGGSGLPPVTVLDWQTVTVGPAASDAAYLVGGSLPVPARRQAEQELFDVYWRALAASGVPVSREQCWRAYRTNTLAGVHMTAVGAMLVEPDERSTAMFVAMAERHAAHAHDLEALSLLEERG